MARTPTLTRSRDWTIPQARTRTRLRPRAGWFPYVVVGSALGWYARKSYYVGVAGQNVVVYKGVPGGVLGWDPTVDQQTGVVDADLQASRKVGKHPRRPKDAEASDDIAEHQHDAGEVISHGISLGRVL